MKKIPKTKYTTKQMTGQAKSGATSPMASRPPVDSSAKPQTKSVAFVFPSCKTKTLIRLDIYSKVNSNWLENGMKEYEVMKLAGHASFATTHKFYLAVSERLVSRARDASKQAIGTDFVAHLLRAPLRA